MTNKHPQMALKAWKLEEREGRGCCLVANKSLLPGLERISCRQQCNYLSTAKSLFVHNRAIIGKKQTIIFPQQCNYLLFCHSNAIIFPLQCYSFVHNNATSEKIQDNRQAVGVQVSWCCLRSRSSQSEPKIMIWTLTSVWRTRWRYNIADI